MESAALEHAEPIFELATKCERLYAEQIARLEEGSRINEATILSELNHRFAAWSAFLGVFADPEICLDRRLRHHVDIREQVLRLMHVMERNLAFVIEADNSLKSIESDHPDEPQDLSINIENLEAIPEAIERLNHIGIAIRQSSVTSHTTKARDFAETFDFTSFEGFAYLALKTMYAAASEELLELLTRSMTETYALFLHRKSRHEQLQAPRSRSHTSVSLYNISEESAANADDGSRMDLDPQTSQQGRNLTVALLQPRPLPRQVPKTRLHFEPTSIDSQEAKVRMKKTRSPSIKGATTSILLSQADYPRPAEGSIICNWCFSPLAINDFEGDRWQKHVNEDHNPYVCISEKCPESSPRFSTSRKWLEHMLTTHGQNWYREVYAPSSWICPLCNDDDTAFPIPDELAGHLADNHGETFAQPEIQAIVQQSLVRSPRPRNECPLCCLSIEDQQGPPSKEKSEGREEKLISKKLRDDANEDRSHKRAKTKTGYTELDRPVRADDHQAPPEQRLQEPMPKANPYRTKHPTVESIASHIAGHLQAIMALTLRMISIDVAIGVSVDNQSVRGGTDNHSSREGSVQRSLDQKSDTLEDIPLPEDGDMVYDALRLKDIPDSEEHFNWNNMPLYNEGSNGRRVPAGGDQLGSFSVT
ncbi:MAG: hypothetical protein M1821_008356 [Bathelium mastoideum]|nr:MAG: hypothetical protein M1821_008356 [Bathelium mastoideum]